MYLKASFWPYRRFLVVVLLSVFQDGTVIVHTIRRGQFLRSLRPPVESSVLAQISELHVGMEGHIVVQTSLEECAHRKVKLYAQWWQKD